MKAEDREIRDQTRGASAQQSGSLPGVASV